MDEKQAGSRALQRGTASEILQKLSSVLILVALIIVMSIANRNFFKSSNFLNILKQSSTMGVMSVGQTMVMLTGGIDLSVGNVMAVTGCLMAVVPSFGFSTGISILLGLLLGIAVGFLNGIIITKGQIQPFIATLGIMLACRGLALIITDGLSVSGMPEPMLVVGSGLFMQVPVSIYLMIAVILIGYVILTSTRYGRNIFAVGGNAEASTASGIKVDKVKMIAYAISGFCSGLAALCLIGRLNSASGLMGSGYELNSITAVALGGTSLAGGKGGMIGTLIGTITIGVLKNGLDLMNVTSFWQDVILGMMIVLVVLLDSWRSRKFRD